MDGQEQYRKAGVDIAKGDQLVDWLKAEQQLTANSTGQLIAGIGGFSGVFEPRLGRYENPLLVAATDGVGTKLLLAIEHDCLDGVGIDLVAMCVNDLYCIGAQPMFFVDYFATGRLDDHQFKAVLTGIKQGLKQANTILLGGETAELPGLYRSSHFDLAGFVVGIVDRTRMLGASRVKVGDVLIGLGSSGFHSNGYSLIRQWLKDHDTPDSELIDSLLQPTRIYSELDELVKNLPANTLHGLAHITGGGISGNLIRVLQDNQRAVIERSKIQTPAWMKSFIERHTKCIWDVEKTFNLGLGMVAAVEKDQRQEFIQLAHRLGLEAFEIGLIEKADKREVCYE